MSEPKIYNAPLRIIDGEIIKRKDETLHHLSSREKLTIEGETLSVGGTNTIILTQGRIIVSDKDQNSKKK